MNQCRYCSTELMLPSWRTCEKHDKRIINKKQRKGLLARKLALLKRKKLSPP